MALTLAQKLINLGMPPEQAKLIADAVGGGDTTVAWADIDGAQAGVEAAVAAKTEIAALTSESTAAEIVAALQA